MESMELFRLSGEIMEEAFEKLDWIMENRPDDPIFEGQNEYVVFPFYQINALEVLSNAANRLANIKRIYSRPNGKTVIVILNAKVIETVSTTLDPILALKVSWEEV